MSTYKGNEKYDDDVHPISYQHRRHSDVDIIESARSTGHEWQKYLYYTYDYKIDIFKQQWEIKVSKSWKI